MQVSKVSFDAVKSLSERDKDYQLRPELFREFFKYTPDIEGLKQAIIDRKKFPVDRSLLVTELRHQARNISLSPKQTENLEALKLESTFTVITAHQPSLLTGPAYFVIKILSTINLAANLSDEQNKIVPCFIIGGEDHDFEEINHLNLYGKRIEWNAQHNGGPVGRMPLTELDKVVNDFIEIAGDSENAQVIRDNITNAFSKSKTYGELHYNLVNNLFGKYGLIVASMDSYNLKKAFVPIMTSELIEMPSFQLINDTQNQLSKKGYGEQAFARDINLFYIDHHGRNRIESKANLFEVVDTDMRWTKDELLQHLNEYPERFSPNVVMRPLFQESIFPNIAYIGGGGELAYWLERKLQFQHFKVFYPALIRRNSLMILTKGQVNSLDKLGLSVKDLFREEHELIHNYLESITHFDITLENEIKLFEELINKVSLKAAKADHSLKSMVEAEGVKLTKSFNQIESRIKRSLKKKEEVSVNQIKKLKEKLFPNNGLQERHDNFFQFELTYGHEVYDKLLKVLDPLDKEFLIVHPNI